jgi:two-component system, chemotaxis family, CheB/CheR fusion protein
MADKELPNPEFEKLISYIQESRGLDFRGYKRTSLQRRIRRRMEETGCADYSSYFSFLEVHPQEFVDLLNTVLINVTSFFRDEEAWDVLKTQVVPKIVAAKSDRDPIRIWSVGCASGEEPYSLAMLFAEELGNERFCRRMKIYATDLDEEALRTARQAVYGPREISGVPENLLEKYFEPVGNQFVFQRELRKCVIFGRHNIVNDAPISKIDLLVCRNLLIYLETETQNIVLPRLHYALSQGGYLFLGKAETQLARSRLFDPVDLKSRIFRKVEQEWRRNIPGGLSLTANSQHGKANDLAYVIETIVNNNSTAYLAITTDGGVLAYVNAAARRLLNVTGDDVGRPFQDLAVSYRPIELRSRIEEVQRTGLPVRIEHQEYPLSSPAEPLRLSIEITPLYGRDGRQIATVLGFNDTTRVYQLKMELEAAQESLETSIEELQSTNEELETTNEELQSTNEELVTTNEELQSTNEELETMNEELRSTNDELESANTELRRQTELATEYQRYSEAILRSLDAGIIVLDQEIKIRSWNRWSENVWGLRSEEVIGQPFLDLDIGLPVYRLRDALHRTVDDATRQTRMELEALDRRGRSMCCRVRVSALLHEERTPHGTVITIEDITEQKRSEAFTGYIGRIIGQSLNEVYFLEPENFRFILVNQGGEKKLGFSLDQLHQISLIDLMPETDLAEFRKFIAPLLSGEQTEMVFEASLQHRDGTLRPTEMCLQFFGREAPPILVVIVHDIADRRRIGWAGREAARESQQQG